MKKQVVYLSLIIGLFLVFIPNLSKAADMNLADFNQFIGEEENDGAGSALSEIGDINADGYDDFMIGAPSHNVSGVGANSGIAYLIYGQADSYLSVNNMFDISIEFRGVNAGDMAGGQVAGAGDVNADGYDDFLIAAAAKDSSTGSVYLIYGKAEKYAAEPLSGPNFVEFSGESATDSAGDALSALGDVNGDGFDDFAISATNDDESYSDAGAVYIIYGKENKYTSMSLGDTSIIKIKGESIDDYLGSALGGGDLDGDGYSDIIMSASSYSSGSGIDWNGAVYILYGQAETFSAMEVNNSAFRKIIGEADSDFLGGALESGADVNGDGYDDLLIGSSGNDAGGAGAGAGYLIYGQEEVITSMQINDPSAVKFTGETAGDIAGIDLSMVGDVDNDGYDDILIGGSMNDASAADAGAAYLINGSADVLSNFDLGDDEVQKFLGEIAADIAGDVVSAAGDVNGDGFNELLISAYAHDENVDNDGMTYLGYLYLDEDGDGVAGDGGLLSGDDCDDADAENTPGEVEINDDQDNNCNDEIDEINEGTHPDKESLDPNDDSIHDTHITSVVGAENGSILVTYDDNSSFLYQVYNMTTTKVTKVLQYRELGLYQVLHPQGKRAALVNIYNGATLDKKVINKTKKYKYNSIKTFKLRKKYWSVVTSKKKNGKTRLAVIRVKPVKQEFGKKVVKNTQGKNIKVSKTKRKNNKIKLRKKNGNVAKKYLFTKKYKLKRI